MADAMARSDEAQAVREQDLGASPAHGGPPAVLGSSRRSAEAWAVDFGPPKLRRRATLKERRALAECRFRQFVSGSTAASAAVAQAAPSELSRADDTALSEPTPGPPLRCGERSAAGVATSGDEEDRHCERRPAPLPCVSVRGLEDVDALVPRHLTTTRAALEARLVLRLPRLLCVNKQYPRSCGVSSLSSIYNYLYSWLGETAASQTRAPVSQEEVMTVLGFAPPFGEIAWGSFTGNATLIRWFHALNRHYGLRGKAYILYKAHGKGRTLQLYRDNAAVLAAVKAALRDPHCALIYHCYNHYMVPIGYQDIPRAQTDFLRPDVPPESCDTTIFIGDVSRGKHEAMYARRWSEIVQDIESVAPSYFDIRRTHLGIQTRQPKSSAATEALPCEAAQPLVAAAADVVTPDAQLPTAPAFVEDEDEDSGAEEGGDKGGAKEEGGATMPPQRRRPREPGNNLHCLICFRNDETEIHMERYEETSSGTSTPRNGSLVNHISSADSTSSNSSSSSTSCSEEDSNSDVVEGNSDNNKNEPARA